MSKNLAAIKLLVVPIDLRAQLLQQPPTVIALSSARVGSASTAVLLLLFGCSRLLTG